MRPDASPHVAMLVRNQYTHDSRVEKEARTLVGAGYRVTVMADADAGLPEHEERDGAHIVRVPRAARALPGLRFMLQELRLAHRLTELSPQVLHAHDSNALLPVALAARRLGVPFVYDAHELWLHRPRRGRTRLYEHAFRLWYRLLQRWAIPRSAATLTVSAPIAAHLERHYGLSKVHLVPNYPDSEELGNTDAKRSIRELAGGRIPRDAPIVLHLGGIMAERGIEELVEAIAHRGDAHLVLLGEGAHWPAVERRADSLGVSGLVHRLGPVPPSEVVSYAASATIGVQATVPTGLNNRYSLPNKLFQYMAAGIPVVASDFRQIRDVVDGARCGLVVDTTRPQAIAGALDRLLGAPDEAREMGRRGRDAVRQRYNWASSAATLRGVYDSLIG